MIFAQINNSIVVNTLSLDDPSLLPLFRNDQNGNPYDLVLQVDNTYPQPGIGWMFDGIAFYIPSTLALIQNNVIVSITENSSGFMANNAANYQAIIDITNFNPQPALGWLYNVDGSLSAPPAYPSVAFFEAIVTNAIIFGNKLIVQYATQNVMLGITQAGQTAAIMSYTGQLLNCLSTGSLYEAITQINTMIADTSSTKTSLAPFLTNDVLYTYMNSIQSYLGIPLTPNPGS